MHWLGFTDHVNDISVLLLLVYILLEDILSHKQMGKEKTNQNKINIGKLIQVEFKPKLGWYGELDEEQSNVW